MKKLKKRQITAISLAVGVVMLSSAALANFASSNGYEVYKKSLKELLKADNYTMNMEAKVSIDGEEMVSGTMEELYDRNGDVKLNQKEISKNRSREPYESKMYYQDGMRISGSSYDYDKEGNRIDRESYYVNDTQKSQYVGNFLGDLAGNMDEEDVKTQEKMINFIELCGDLVVGDLKNNFVYTSSEGNQYNYAINLDNFQIPEIINAGLSMVTAAQGKYYDNVRYNGEEVDPMDNPMALFTDNAYVKSANCYVTVDDQGRLVKNTGDFTLGGKDSKGNEHELTVSIAISFSNYGTTQPQRVDLNSLPNVTYQSKQNETRIEELKALLAGDNLSEEDRKNYEEEVQYLERKEGIITTQNNVTITYPDQAAADVVQAELTE